MPKSKGRCSPKCLHDSTLWPKPQTLEGSLGRTRMKTPNMVKRPSKNNFTQFSKTYKILAIQWEGLFWVGNGVDAPSSFGLWVWPLKASHYSDGNWRSSGSSWPKVWTLHSTLRGFTLCPAAGFNSYFFGLSTKLAILFHCIVDFHRHRVRPRDNLQI